MKTAFPYFKILPAALLLFSGCQTEPIRHAGPLEGGAQLMPTYQLLHPAGISVEFGGRPIDLVLAPNGRTLFVKDNRGLVVIDAETWIIRQELKLRASGGSTHGIAITRDGKRVYISTAHNSLWEAIVGEDGKVSWGKRIALPGPGRRDTNSHPSGIALSAARRGRNQKVGRAVPGEPTEHRLKTIRSNLAQASCVASCGSPETARPTEKFSQPATIFGDTDMDESKAYVCLSRNNTLGVVDLGSGKLAKQISVGVAPFDVAIMGDGKTAYVSNWGGRRPTSGEKTAKSSGTDTLVDDRGVAASGTVSVVDLEGAKETAQIETGLHPSDLELSADGRTLYVANANSDSVSVIDTTTQKVIHTVVVRPDPGLPFGSAPNALALSKDGSKLYVANGGNNAVAVLNCADRQAPRTEGFVPTAWYPGALALDENFLYVANVKGLGSRKKQPNKRGWNSHDYLGTVGKVSIPSRDALDEFTRQVKADSRMPDILRTQERSTHWTTPVAVPNRLGDPSVFEHIVYIVKENRTYDQVFGDLPQGNGDPELCVFGRDITPNHHALAQEFVLLDNYYCNGVLSADGHAWAMEGYVTDYLEKSFGGFTRSYPFSGDDPISFAPTGFIWDNVLLHGLSFRNYGEMNKTAIVPNNATFKTVFDDYKRKAGKVSFKHDIQIDTLRRYSCPESPGWNLKIPDQIRADVFLKEFESFKETGACPNFMIIFLPSDHTSGTSVGGPTPRAQVADNDLAVGRIVESISHSQFWPKTCIFVIEDDPQAGFDHVDGHRSLCLVVSPYTKRGAVVSHFYNQTSVLHTMERMFGLPPMNQMDARAPLMKECFTPKPDVTPYTCRPNLVPLDELNKRMAELKGEELYWAEKSLELQFDDVDQADEDTLNRIIWHSVKGVDHPYPAQLAGAHGKGFKALGLKFGAVDDDD